MASNLAGLELEGFEELTKKFNTMEEKLRKKALRPALRAGAKVIEKKVKQNAPLGETGNLKRTLKVKSLKRSRRQIGVMVTTGSRDQLKIPRTRSAGYYPFSVEYGSPRRGIRAQKYMKRAFLSENKKALEAVGKKLGEKMEQIAKQRA